jgi:hypothetical protein
MTASRNLLSIRSPGFPLPLAPLAEEFSMPYLDAVIGAAIFDLSGLPKEYLASQENPDLSWVQAIFQALGLQSLLGSSLQLEGLRYAVAHGIEFQAIVVRQEACYTALLIRSSEAQLDPQFIQWAKQLEPTSLKGNLRFISK